MGLRLALCPSKDKEHGEYIVNRFLRLAATVGLAVSGLLVVSTSALAVAPSQAPTIVSPTGGLDVGSSNPVLSWHALSGATRYQVQVSTQESFSSTLYTQTTYALQATPPDQLPFGTLWWRVAGDDGSGNVGPYAKASFTESLNTAPTMLTPTNSQTLTFPTQPLIFSWNPVAGASSYTLQVSASVDFTSYTQYASLKNTSYTPIDTQSFTMGNGATQVWYWRVQASFPSSQVSPWSSPWNYQISWPASPILQTPIDHANITEVVLSWDAVLGAQSYEVQISPSEDWENATIDQTGVLSTRYAPYVTLDNGSYYWRVRARAAGTATNWGPWSTDRQFTRSWSTRPVPVAPFYDGVTVPSVSNLEFSWTPVTAGGAGWVDHASMYEIQISTQINFSGAVYDCLTSHTTFTPYKLINPSYGSGEPSSCMTMPFNLSQGATYYWQVRGVDGPAGSATYNTGVNGLWDNTSSSDTQRFEYDPTMADATSCGTANGATTATPVLCWGAVSNEELYHVTVRNKTHTIIVETDTYGSTYTPTVTLPAAGNPYEWNVYGIEGTNTLAGRLDPTKWRTFNIADPGTTTNQGDPITILTPAAGGHSVRQPSMTWVPVAGADHYKVWYGTHYTVNGTPLSGALLLPYAGFTYTGTPEYTSPPLAFGQWYWMVIAYDASDQEITGSESPYQSFWVGSVDASTDWIVPWNHYLTPECVPQTDPSISRCVPQVGDTQELSWTPDPNAGAYAVYVAKDAHFTTIFREYQTTQTTLTPKESWADSQAGESYYWFVQPCMDWDLAYCGPGPQTNVGLNNASAYKKASPALTGLSTTTAANPPVTATTIGNQITFKWNDYIVTSQAATYPVTNVVSSRPTAEANRYRIQVATDSQFASIIDQKVVDQTSYTPWELTYPDQTLYWRVQAVDASNLNLTWSGNGTANVVTKQSPAVLLASPADASTVHSVPYFTWQPLNWAAQYKIEVYKNGDTNWSSGNLFATATTAVASWSPTDSMPAGIYAWRVQALDANTNPHWASPWSTGRTFTFSGLAPTLTTPSDGGLVGDGSNVLFQWTGVQNAAAYKIEYSTLPGVGGTTIATTTSMTAYSPLTKLTASGDGTTYYWRVSVLDSASPGNILATSTVFSFIVGTTPNQPTNVQATAGNASATVTWTAPTSSGTHPIQGYVVTSNPDGKTCTATPASHTTCTVGGLTNGTSYTFSVHAYSDVGDGQESTPSWPTVTPAGTNHLLVTAPSSVSCNVAFSVTVEAVDAVGNLDSAYRGAIHLTSTDSAALLPSDYTFTLGDAGQHTFSVTLKSFGTFSITATDKAVASYTGTKTGINVGWAAGTYHAISPRRVLDTRATSGVHTNVGLSGKFSNAVVRSFNVAGAHYVKSYNVISSGTDVAIPSDAIAVTGNITVVNSSAAGLVALGPVMTPTGSVTTINFAKGDVVANNVTMGLSGTGTLSAVYRATNWATVDLIFDITGYFRANDATGATYTPLPPGRILDTRTGAGHMGSLTKLQTGQPKSFGVVNASGLGWTTPKVPAGTVAVTGNVTVTNATSNGFVSVGPTMIANPTTSTVNVTTAKNRANGVTVALSGGKLGVVWVGSKGSSADVIFDVTGYFTAGMGGLKYHAIMPVRVLDSSKNIGLSGSFSTGSNPVSTKRTMLIGSSHGVPSDAAGISGNLTLIQPTVNGWAFIAPSITALPNSSTVNGNAYTNTANGFDVALSATGYLDLIWKGTTGSHANLQMDITGYWK